MKNVFLWKILGVKSKNKTKEHLDYWFKKKILNKGQYGLGSNQVLFPSVLFCLGYPEVFMHFCWKKETDVKLSIRKGRMDRYKIEGQIICCRECRSRNNSFILWGIRENSRKEMAFESDLKYFNTLRTGGSGNILNWRSHINTSPEAWKSSLL